MRATPRFTANGLLLDRQILDKDGEPVGRVDDLELTDPELTGPELTGPGGAPVLAALLCGPTALGPRIGGRLGTWWLSIGRRLRARDDPYPNRIPLREVEHADRWGVGLLVSRDMLDADRLRDWVRDKIVARIPGSGS